MGFTIHHGDCLDVLRGMESGSVDSVVTDPPYGLAFMGKRWDYDVPSAEIWAECLRVLKPGGHLVAFAGTRTQHRMAVNIEDAGFTIRDMLAWVYGSGFPKSQDVSKAIDKAAGAEREVLSERKTGWAGTLGGKAALGGLNGAEDVRRTSAPATDLAREWQGWGTALKPALEPITLARKPFKGTVAANVTEHGTGALNVDGCRVGNEQTVTIRNGDSGGNGAFGRDERVGAWENPPGRFPANLLHDGSEEVLGLFPVTTTNKGTLRSKVKPGANVPYSPDRPEGTILSKGDTGSAARFFYCAKASKKDRDSGGVRNIHTTVKPTDLMRWLCRLVTPPGGVVLDPFTGSGSTGKAALSEGFRFIGIEREAEYVEIARRRCAGATDLLTVAAE